MSDQGFVMERGKESPMDLSVQPLNWNDENVCNTPKRPLSNDPQPLFIMGSQSSHKKQPRLGRKMFHRGLSFHDSDEEDEDILNSHSFRKSVKKKKGFFDSMKHAYFPYIVMGYLQLFFNLFIVGLVIYLVVLFVRTVQRDVDIKVEGYLIEIMSEIAQCSKQFTENKCFPDQRVPAMEKACVQWENCMNRDPAVVGRAKVSAETFAEIINSFIEPISLKTMAFFSILVFGFLFLSNYAFGYARSKVASPFRNPQESKPPNPSHEVRLFDLFLESVSSHSLCKSLW